MSEFPLLKLPYVALKEVVRCLSPIEIFNFSLCSSNLALPVGTNNFTICVNDHHDGRRVSVNGHKFLVLDKSHEYFQKSMSTYKFGTEIVKGRYQEDKVETYWWNRNLNDGLFILAAYLSKLFKSQIRYFEVPWNFETSPSISDTCCVQELRIYDYQNPKILKWLLDHIKVSKILRIDASCYKDFEYLFFEGILEEFHATNATWMTFPTLSTLNSCKEIVITGSNLTNNDLDKFIKLWKSGKFLKLEYFKVQSEKFTKEEKILGFTMKQLESQQEKKYKWFDDRRLPCDRGMDIQNENGDLARIWFYSNVSFSMFVWKNGEDRDGSYNW